MSDTDTYEVSMILGCGVSLFPSVFSKEAKRYTMGSVLNSFASQRYAKIVREARGYMQEGDTEMYKACKSMLPVVAFCGVFEGGHSKANLVHYNNIVILDIDPLIGNRLRDRVSKDWCTSAAVRKSNWMNIIVRHSAS